VLLTAQPTPEFHNVLLDQSDWQKIHGHC